MSRTYRMQLETSQEFYAGEPTQADMAEWRAFVEAEMEAGEVAPATRPSVAVAVAVDDDHDCQEWPPQGDAWAGGFAANH